MCFECGLEITYDHHLQFCFVVYCKETSFKNIRLRRKKKVGGGVADVQTVT